MRETTTMRGCKRGRKRKRIQKQVDIVKIMKICVTIENIALT